MRKIMLQTLCRILCLAALASAAFAQNSDIGVLFGVSAPVNTVGNGQVVSSVGGSFALTYAAQLLERRAGQLYLELPFIVDVQTTDNVGHGAVVSSIKDTIFFTPGARWRFSPASRVSFHASLGAGLASFGRTRSFVGSGIVSDSSTRATAGALAFGGGLDFRVTRLLSFRFEGRDGVTASRYDGASHHTMFLFGIGFHF
jgi:hypothetical protein